MYLIKKSGAIFTKLSYNYLMTTSSIQLTPVCLSPTPAQSIKSRVRNSARILESILAWILLNKITRIQVDSRNICYFTRKSNGGESKGSRKWFCKNLNGFVQHLTNFKPWRENGNAESNLYTEGIYIYFNPAKYCFSFLCVIAWLNWVDKYCWPHHILQIYMYSTFLLLFWEI